MPRVVTLVHWIFYPEWLTLDATSFMTGYDVDLLRDLAKDGELVACQTLAGWMLI